MNASTKLFFNQCLGILLIALTGMAFIIRGNIYIGVILILISFGFNRYNTKMYLNLFEKENESLKNKVKKNETS